MGRGSPRVLTTVLAIALLGSAAYGGWQQRTQLSEVRAELAAQGDENAANVEALALASTEAEQAADELEALREQVHGSAAAAAEAREAADEASAQAAAAVRAAEEAAVAEAEAARAEAERQAAAAAEAQEQADAAAERAGPAAADCPEGPGEEAAACWAQREGLTLTCPGTDHWVRSLDECTPEALFGPDWEEYVDP